MDAPSHRRLIIFLVVAVHVLIALSLVALSHFPAFDTSANILLDSSWSQSLLRWDSFHFVHVARDGYVNEHEYAFFPGASIAMRVGAKVLKALNLCPGNDVAPLLLAGSLLSAVVGVDAALALYDLTLLHFRSRSLALLVVILSLLSQSPQTLRFAPYAEPFFAHLSYRGMLFCAQGNYVFAAMAFALASFCRSNGTILAGYLIWALLIKPSACTLQKLQVWSKPIFRTALYCCLLCAVILVPSIVHHYRGYSSFCVLSNFERRPWCNRTLPLIYPFVQSEYWNVGFLRYWTWKQSPNLFIASPILLLLVYSSMLQFRYSLWPLLQLMPRFLRLAKADGRLVEENGEKLRLEPLYDVSIIPYAMHSLFLSVACLVSAHTQILLRLASALPFTYWAIVHLFLNSSLFATGKSQIDSKFPKKPTSFTRGWLLYSSLWATIGLTTWAVFLPPA